MPEYSYRCKKCNLVFQDLITISKCNDLVDCENEKCNGKASRDRNAELANSRGSRVKQITENGHWSRAMGVPPGQVAEFRKRFPNSTYNNKGDVWVKNVKDKRRQQKERGMVSLNDNNSKAWFR